MKACAGFSYVFLWQLQVVVDSETMACENRPWRMFQVATSQAVILCMECDAKAISVARYDFLRELMREDCYVRAAGNFHNIFLSVHLEDTKSTLHFKIGSCVSKHRACEQTACITII